MNYRNQALRDLARDKPCQHCGADDGTCVWAHSNLGEHGKGKSLKAHDCFGAILCYRCHSWLDQGSSGLDPTGVWSPTRDDKREMFIRAMHKTWLFLWERGLIRVSN